MLFERIIPPADLSDFIECFWIVADDDPVCRKQKIVPDGFTEIIFHFGERYRIQLGDKWELQEKSLLAGQIDKYFFLENTGSSNVLGIKLKPATLTHLYNLNMHEFSNKVLDLYRIGLPEMTALDKSVRAVSNHDERITVIIDYFRKTIERKSYTETAVDGAINIIFKNHGMVNMVDACRVAGVGERQLENLFKKYVGLSPKLFARIIRFNYIFQLTEQPEQSWAGLAYEAAYYDQSHFIRNFKNFTGESPAAWAFDEKNMANFFLKKSRL